MSCLCSNLTVAASPTISFSTVMTDPSTSTVMTDPSTFCSPTLESCLQSNYRPMHGDIILE